MSAVIILYDFLCYAEAVTPAVLTAKGNWSDKESNGKSSWKAEFRGTRGQTHTKL